jgi:Zn-dependent membrane protease YugP
MLNPLYLLLILPGLLGWYAQKRVRDIYERYGEVPNQKGADGVEIARSLLTQHGLQAITVERTPGHLTDHYDPQKKVLSLSDGVANGRSITALGIVAHEVGHAVQDAQGYRFMQARTWLAQRVGVLAQWSSFIFVGGMLFGNQMLMALGGVLLFGMLVFSLVALPVERDASRRALASLEQAGLTNPEEKKGVKKVLKGAAFTYLAGIGQRLGTFLFFVAVVGAARGAG